MPVHDQPHARASALDSAVAALLKHAMSRAREALRAQFPIRQAETRWLEEADGGGYEGRSAQQALPDSGIWFLLRDELSASSEWVTAASEIERYIEATGTPIAEDWMTHTTMCQQALTHYLSGVRSFKFSDRRAKATCRELRRYCESQEDRWETFIAFDGLTAARAFKLDAHVAFHRISPRELRLFGTHDELRAWSRDERVVPRSDWWIAVVYGTGPKGTAVAHNQSGEITTRLLDCFPLLHSGALRAI